MRLKEGIAEHSYRFTATAVFLRSDLTEHWAFLKEHVVVV